MDMLNFSLGVIDGFHTEELEHFLDHVQLDGGRADMIMSPALTTLETQPPCAPVVSESLDL